MKPSLPVPGPSTDFLAKKLATVLLEKGLSLAIAESCTGGMLGAAITSVAGSSSYFKGGVIAYSNDLKLSLLAVKKSILDKYGAVSPAAARSMAEGACRACRADCAIAITGIAGPGGGTRLKPVGLVYVGIAFGGNAKSYRFFFAGNRADVRRQTVVESLRKMIAAAGAVSSKSTALQLHSLADRFTTTRRFYSRLSRSTREAHRLPTRARRRSAGARKE